MNRSALIKVGLLTIVSLVLLIGVVIWLKGKGITSGTLYTVRFNDVDGMKEGAPVQMMGIRVGFVEQVKAIEVNNKYYVNVDFRVSSPEVNPPAGSIVSIQQSGIIGEKFLELTPPELHQINLTTFAKLADAVKPGMPVKFLYDKGYLQVGSVERVESMTDENMTRYTLHFRVTRPGALPPEEPVYELTLDSDNTPFLRVLPSVPALAQAPDEDLLFTVEEPMRIKDFLAVQMESAESLKMTNDKIVQLLSDDTIATLNDTIKNTEILTARATDVLDSAEVLFEATSKDLELLVDASNQLVANVDEVSGNINAVIGDPGVRENIKSTVASVEHSTQVLSELLDDPAMHETLQLLNQTSRETSELVGTLNATINDRQLQARLDASLTNLNVSLERLSSILKTVDGATGGEDSKFKETINDLHQTADNLRDFSDKLDGHFVLWRLMF